MARERVGRGEPLLLHASARADDTLTDPRPHVLLVDDSALVTGALRVLLEETGHRVTTADSVAAATTAAMADVPDVLLLDLSLPDGDGLAVVEHLRAAGRLPRTFVALTGHDDESLATRCRAAGCRDVLVKPVPVRVLLEKMRKWLGDGPSALGPRP